MYIETTAREKTVEALRVMSVFQTPAQRLASWEWGMLLMMKELREALGVPARRSVSERLAGLSPRARGLEPASRSNKCCDIQFSIGPHTEHARVRFLREWNGPPLFQKGRVNTLPAVTAQGLIEMGIAARA